MTPEERAQRLVTYYRNHNGAGEQLSLAGLIEGAIRAAVAEAYEDALMIADNDPGAMDVAQAIRVRAKEVLGGGHGTGD